MSDARDWELWPGGIAPRTWAERIASAQTREDRRRIAAQVPETLRALVRSHLETIKLRRLAASRRCAEDA